MTSVKKVGVVLNFPKIGKKLKLQIFSELIS